MSMVTWLKTVFEDNNARKERIWNSLKSIAHELDFRQGANDLTGNIDGYRIRLLKNGWFFIYFKHPKHHLKLRKERLKHYLSSHIEFFKTSNDEFNDLFTYRLSDKKTVEQFIQSPELIQQFVNIYKEWNKGNSRYVDDEKLAWYAGDTIPFNDYYPKVKQKIKDPIRLEELQKKVIFDFVELAKSMDSCIGKYAGS